VRSQEAKEITRTRPWIVTLSISLQKEGFFVKISDTKAKAQSVGDSWGGYNPITLRASSCFFCEFACKCCLVEASACIRVFNHLYVPAT